MLDFLRTPKIKKLIVHFSRFTIIGIVAAVLNIFLVWLFIDIFKFKTLIGTIIVVGFIFLLKFYLYILIKLIKKRFFRYALVQLISILANIFLTWFLIDMLLIPTIIATTIVVGGLFIGRFILFKVLGLIAD